MKSLLLITTCAILFGKGSATICYNCSSLSVSPTEGCGDGLNMNDEFLVKCPEDKPYCSVLFMNGTFKDSGIPLHSYTRACTDTMMNDCFPPPAAFEGTSCFTSCKTDACNKEQTSKPDARVATLAPPVMPDTSTIPKPASPKTPEAIGTPEPKSTPEPTTKPEPPAEPEPESTPEPSKTPKPEPTTTPEDNTTSNAQKVGLQIHTIINLFVCLVSTILFSGYRMH